MFILQKKSSKRSSVHFNCGSYDPAWIFLPELRKSFAQSVEVVKKIVLVFPEKMFLPKNFLRARSIFTILPKAFAESWFVFLLLVRKW